MPIAVFAQGAAALPLGTWVAKRLHGWIEYHREGNDDYTAYCHECTEKDPAMRMERKKEKWTERVRCSAGLWDKKTWELIWQCNQCWQSCRIEGGAPSQCLRYWGWGKSRGKKTQMVLPVAHEEGTIGSTRGRSRM